MSRICRFCSLRFGVVLPHKYCRHLEGKVVNEAFVAHEAVLLA